MRRSNTTHTYYCDLCGDSRVDEPKFLRKTTWERGWSSAYQELCGTCRDAMGDMMFSVIEARRELNGVVPKPEEPE